MLQRKTELDKTIMHWTIPTLIEKDRFLDQAWHQKAKTMSISLVKKQSTLEKAKAVNKNDTSDRKYW